MLFKNYQISCFFAVLEFFAVCDHHLLKINLNQLITSLLGGTCKFSHVRMCFPGFYPFFPSDVVNIQFFLDFKHF